MRYTDEEKQKIAECLDKIVTYIDTEVRPKMHEPIYVNISSANSISIPDDGTPIRGNLNSLRVVFAKEDENRSSSFYSYYSVYSLDSVAIVDYVETLLTYWKAVKENILSQLDRQQRMLDTINNFEL